MKDFRALKDLRTSLVDVIAERLGVWTWKEGYSPTNRQAAEIAADVVLERLESIGGQNEKDGRWISSDAWNSLPNGDSVYRWREPIRADGNLSPAR